MGDYSVSVSVSQCHAGTRSCARYSTIQDTRYEIPDKIQDTIPDTRYSPAQPGHCTTITITTAYIGTILCRPAWIRCCVCCAELCLLCACCAGRPAVGLSYCWTATVGLPPLDLDLRKMCCAFLCLPCCACCAGPLELCLLSHCQVSLLPLAARLSHSPRPSHHTPAPRPGREADCGG